jgi:hypothetical protein
MHPTLSHLILLMSESILALSKATQSHYRSEAAVNFHPWQRYSEVLMVQSSEFRPQLQIEWVWFHTKPRFLATPAMSCKQELERKHRRILDSAVCVLHATLFAVGSSETFSGWEML